MTASVMRRVWGVAAPVFDAAVVFCAVLGAWWLLRHSPFAAPQAPQWARERYLVAGVFSAIAYVLLTAAAGLYSPVRAPVRERIPLLNFGIVCTLFLLSLLAFARYAAWTENDVLLSRRVLFTALVAAFLVTSLHHYVRLGFLRSHMQHTQGRP